MRVDPGRVPVKKLSSGALMPAIGLGTFGSDQVAADEVAAAVAGALEVGYRHFDCASVYNNEVEIGRALKGCPREELHPHFQQPALFNYLVGKGIQPIGFCPVGSPARPARDRSPDDTVDIEDPVIARIAADHDVHPAIVCIKWALQRGQVPIPFSTQRHHYEANLRATLGDPLSEAEMTAIAGIDRDNRLIKGHVFLWREGQSWEDLWDLDGVVKS